jgi:23S rRNA pseudouridine1911/1915/1917 synthase
MSLPDQYTSLVVKPDESGRRVDVFLARHLPEYSRSQLQKLFDSGAVEVDGEAVRKRHLLHTGQQVKVGHSRLPSLSITPEAEDIPLRILYEDDSLIAVDKPAGMVVHPGSGNKSGTLVNALLHHTDRLAEGFAEGRPGIVHRLDKDTSGVIVAAKTGRAHASLASQFAGRTVEKHYLGLCIGEISQAEGLIDAPLARSKRDPVKRSVRRYGKEARTEYHLLRAESGISVVRFRLLTGRTHQIRVHCAHIHTPIVADTIYGGGSATIKKLPPLCRPFAHKVYKCFARHALHACSLRVAHPERNETLQLTAPLPDDFRKALMLFEDGEQLMRVAGSG